MDTIAGQAEAAAARARRLPLKHKLGFAVGGLVDGTALHPLNIFLLFYLTSVAGMAPGLAGAAIAAGLVVDAIADPLIGSVSDHCRSRFGRRLPFMLGALLPIALSLTLLFSLPVSLGGIGLFAWVAVLSVALRVSVSLFLLPVTALGAELSDDYRERSTLMTLRWFFFMSGGIAGLLLGFGVFFAGPEGLMARGQYTPFAISLSLIVIGGGLVACRTALATRGREHPPMAGSHSASAFSRELAECLRNPSFRIVLATNILFFVGFGVNSVLGIHANTLFWKLTGGQTQAVTMALFFGLFLGAPLGGLLLARLEKRTVLALGISMLLACQSAPVLLRLAGLFPFEGSALATVLTLFALMMGMFMGAAGIAMNAMGPDVADQHEVLFGTRREGLFAAGNAFANKAASAGGTLVAGLLLGFIALPKDATGHLAGGDVPERSLHLLGLVYGPGAALFSLMAVLTILKYRIDREAHARNIAALSSRRLAMKVGA
ncbi:MFS transporter [Sphingomonas sp. ERG5]|uniref:MFS transporter n=1 Tax=Sphingomonas sp. ERG5 TaxID=1381597 RepID=UPI0006906933|nr:MFS transporter [Sphingomonas sp. ERG5]